MASETRGGTGFTGSGNGEKIGGEVLPTLERAQEYGLIIGEALEAKRASSRRCLHEESGGWYTVYPMDLYSHWPAVRRESARKAVEVTEEMLVGDIGYSGFIVGDEIIQGDLWEIGDGVDKDNPRQASFRYIEFDIAGTGYDHPRSSLLAGIVKYTPQVGSRLWVGFNHGSNRLEVTLNHLNEWKFKCKVEDDHVLNFETSSFLTVMVGEDKSVIDTVSAFAEFLRPLPLAFEEMRNRFSRGKPELDGDDSGKGE